MDIRALVRIEQARLVVEDAHADVSGWLKALAAADPRRHHASTAPSWAAWPTRRARPAER
ncbi:MAG: hypothetical protein R3F43_28225 [bacterium]